MRIGLISDTHIPEVVETLPSEVTKAFKEVDLILHAGDIFVPSVLDELQNIAPVFAAKGDDDYWPEVKDDQRIRGKHVLNLGGQTVWLVHDPFWAKQEVLILRESREEVDGETPSVVVHGHLHRASIEHFYGVLFVNPGSPTFLDYRQRLGTVAILTIIPYGANVNFIRL